MPYGEKFEEKPVLRGAGTSGSETERNTGPLRHPPARGSGHRRRERRDRGRGRRRTPARRPRGSGRRGAAEDIRKRFGEEVAGIVAGNTDTFEDPKPPWRGRKERYVAPRPRAGVRAARLRGGQAAQRPVHTRGPALLRRRALAKVQRGKEGTLWYYRALVEAFETAGSNPVVEELDRVVAEMERLSGTRGHRRSTFAQRAFAPRDTRRGQDSPRRHHPGRRPDGRRRGRRRRHPRG